MALKLVCLLLLWDLTLLIHGVTSLCNVICSTDYDTSLNCSCSGSVPAHPILLQATCSDDDGTISDSCEVKPPQSWCIMNKFEPVISSETECSATASQQGRVEMEASKPPLWELRRVVKREPPPRVQVTNLDKIYNITWGDINKEDCFTYRVRIRESKDLSKDPVHHTSTNVKYVLLAHEQLQPWHNYTVDVQAKLCEENLYRGPWSEWSAPAELRTSGPEGGTTLGLSDTNQYWGFILLLPLIGLLGWLQKQFWQRKLITFIPKPNDFFEPLYLTYGGNFKEWVKPVFSEYDYPSMTSHVQRTCELSEKQHDILQWKNEKRSYTDDNETKQGDHVSHMLQPDSNLLLLPLQDHGSSQGTSHSMGHISIHTVTLSGEEFEEEVMSQSSVDSLRSYQAGESFGSFDEDNREIAGYDLGGSQLSMMDAQRGILKPNENQIENINFQPHAQFDEPERLSLDSFASNEQSEDGYPHVDLDTIDSGFVECRSPGALDTVESMASDLFHDRKNFNSNYVKQWMIRATIQEDSGKPENELHETQ